MIGDIVIPSKTLSPKEALLYSVKCIYDKCKVHNGPVKGSSYNDELVLNALSILIGLINNNQPLEGLDTVVTTHHLRGEPTVEIDFCEYDDVFCSIEKEGIDGWVTNVRMTYPRSRTHRRGISFIEFDLGFEVIDDKPTYNPKFL